MVCNVGEIAPITAGEIAKTYGLRLYHWGWNKGKVLQPVAMYPNGQSIWLCGCRYWWSGYDKIAEMTEENI